jgi:Ankyrin repeats (many copies)
MWDCRTKGEAPLHRAAAFGNEEDIQLLLDAGAHIDAKDANGGSPGRTGICVLVRYCICFVTESSAFILNGKSRLLASPLAVPWKPR